MTLKSMFMAILTSLLYISAHESVNMEPNLNEYLLKDLDSIFNTKYILDISKDESLTNLTYEVKPKNLKKFRFRRSTINETIDNIPMYDDKNRSMISNVTNERVSKINLEDKDKIVANRSEELEDRVTTEFFDAENFTEECVGDPEYCNMTKEEYFEMLNEYIYPQPYEWVLIATHAIVFVIGLIGNALVCIAVYRNHSMRTVTNYFIVNLAVADFMVILICLPPTVLWDVTETWFFGTAMCRIVLYFQVSSSFCVY